MPDIDLDFPRDVRERLIPRIHERYGPEHSALVAAFPTYRTRGAIRELGKALGLPPAEIERVARGVGRLVERATPGAGPRHRARRRRPERAGARRRWRAPADAARRGPGLPRHLSQHSGGMVITTRPLIDSARWCPPRWRAGRSSSGTRTPAPTPAS